MLNVVSLERNTHCFEGKEHDLDNLKFLFLKTLYKWTLTSSNFSTVDFLEFLDTIRFR